MPISDTTEQYLTATATDPNNNTSEFSNCAWANLATQQTAAYDKLSTGETR